MRNLSGGDLRETFGLPRLHLVALSSGMDPTTYAVSHSMLGAHRVAGFAHELFEHGSERSVSFSRQLGMRIPKSGACVCSECIQEDLASSGFSWYRRAHQLFGVEWCYIHDEPLHKVDAPNAFDHLPHHWRNARRIVPAASRGIRVAISDSNKRYLDIAMGLLKLKAPLPCSAINAFIGKEMKRLGLLVSRTGQRPYLRNRTDNSSDSKWIQRLLYGSRLDHFVYNFSAPASGFVYALALASIFETSSEAISFIDKASAGLRTSAPEPVDERTNDVTSRQGHSSPVHQSTDSSLSVVTKGPKLRPSQLRDRITEAGPPGPDCFVDLCLWNAFHEFSDGRSIHEACNEENVEPAQLEELIRVYLNRVA